MRKLLVQSPCGFGSKLDLASSALRASEYAVSIGAEFVMLEDRQPRPLDAAWSQAFALRTALTMSKLGDVLCWLAPDARVVTDEDIFSVLESDEWLCTAFANERPHPRSVWLRNCPAAERLLARVLYHARPGRLFVYEFSSCAAGAKKAPPEWVGALSLWAAAPDLPEPRVIAAVGARDVTEIEAMQAVIPAAIEAHRGAPRVTAAPEKLAVPFRRLADPEPVVEQPRSRMRSYGPKAG